MKPIEAPAPTARPAEEHSTHASTLGELFLIATQRHTGPALRHKSDGRWVDTSFRELGESARAIARGLIGLGVEPGDRVAILSDTRPEWTLADAGVMCAGAVAVPIYQTNAAEECRYVLEHSDARVVLCEDAAQADKIARVRDRCPMLEHVVVMDGRAPGAMDLSELRSRGAGIPNDAVERRVRETAPQDLATIVYTSGTTGPPKGCMLSHASLIATVRMYEERLELDERDIVIFIFLPLAHSLARVTQLVTLDVGGTLAFWQRDPARLLDDIREARPTHLPSVPRVFEKIHTAASAGIADLSPVRRAVFKWALGVGRRVRQLERRGARAGVVLRVQHALADRLALSKVRALFGGELQLALTGAAPIAQEVLEFFDACGVLVVEGYGMTESCAASTLNTPRELRFGSVGRPLPGTEVKVAQDGELLIRGPHVFLGYYKDPAATADALVDGWLRTGDLGEVSDDGFVSITGRKKDIIITSSGKNITPTNVENELKTSRWIAEAVVYGDGRPYLVTLLTLDPDEAPALAELTGSSSESGEMCADPRVREEIQREVNAVNERFARIEQVKRFAILDHQLSQEAGEVTPTMKVKRNVVYERYGDTIARLYG